MPELPEVETIRRGLAKSILQQKIVTANIYNYHLRHPIPRDLPKFLKGQTFQKISRRGKYILLQTKTGTLIVHLGMSGTLQLKNQNHLTTKHEHVNITLANDLALCYTDPRRFGAILWTTQDPLKHPLLKNLGLEPLTKDFTAKALSNLAKSRKCSIKQLLMNNSIVTGIGNIYANEVLFAAKINPLKKASTVSAVQFQKLVQEIKRILTLAIKYKGTTIKDHLDSSGNKGSFQNKLKVYGKLGQPCSTCHTKLITMMIGQRSTTFCPRCQK